MGPDNTDARFHLEGMPAITMEVKPKKEEPAKVSYKGFTGELIELKQTHYGDFRYALTICDSEKKVKHSFDDVKFSDIRFLCGVVSFGG